MNTDRFTTQYQQVPFRSPRVGDTVYVIRGGREEAAYILVFEDAGAVLRFADGKERFATKWRTP